MEPKKTRMLTPEERSTFGDCETCKAKPGQSCDLSVAEPARASNHLRVHRAHRARMLKVPYSAEVK